MNMLRYMHTSRLLVTRTWGHCRLWPSVCLPFCLGVCTWNLPLTDWCSSLGCTVISLTWPPLHLWKPGCSNCVRVDPLVSDSVVSMTTPQECSVRMVASCDLLHSPVYTQPNTPPAWSTLHHLNLHQLSLCMLAVIFWESVWEVKLHTCVTTLKKLCVHNEDNRARVVHDSVVEWFALSCAQHYEISSVKVPTYSLQCFCSHARTLVATVACGVLPEFWHSMNECSHGNDIHEPGHCWSGCAGLVPQVLYTCVYYVRGGDITRVDFVWESWYSQTTTV